MDKRKKGFTLVELVIVIAVIAILAAVLVPTFSNVIMNSKLSKDTVLVRNLNVNVIAAEKQNIAPKTVAESVSQLVNDNVTVNDLQLTHRDMVLVYDSVNNRYMIYDRINKKFVFYDKNYEPDLSEENRINYWRFSDSAVTEEENLKDFSVYLYDGYKGNSEITISTGIDVGSNKNITSINYVTTKNQTVSIRTNSLNTSVTIDAPNSVVEHFGKAGEVNIISVASTSYHENGTVGFIEVAGGNVVLEESSKVSGIHFDATNDEFVNEDDLRISLDLTKISYVTELKFSRDKVTSGEKLVAKINGQYIWLTGNGTIENQEIKVSESADGERTSAMATPTGDSIPEQIANMLIVDPETGDTTYEVKTTKEEAKAVVDDLAAEEVYEEMENGANYVARIMANGYTTLLDAIEAAVTDDTVVMLANVSISPISFSTQLTLDLNGKSISGTGQILVFTGTGKFVVKDTQNGGTITGSQVAISNSGNGTVVVKSGTITGTSNYGIYNTQNGVVTIDGGLVIGKYGIYNKSKGTVNVVSGEVRGTASAGIYTYLIGGTINVTGGKVTCASKYGIYSGGDAKYTTANKATINVSGNAQVSGTYAIYSLKPDDITISENAVLTATSASGYGIYLVNYSETAAKVIVNNNVKISNSTQKGGIYVYTKTVKHTMQISGNPEIIGTTYGVYSYGGNVSIDGGVIESVLTDKTKWSYGLYMSSNGTSEIKSGSINSVLVGVYSTGTLNITGGTITSGTRGIMGRGTMNIYDGTIIDANDLAICDYANTNVLTLNIYGGQITSRNYGIELLCPTSVLNFESGNLNAAYVGIKNSGDAKVSGGKVLVEGATKEITTYGILNMNKVEISGTADIQNLNEYSVTVVDQKETENIPYAIFLQGTDSANATILIKGGTIYSKNAYGVDLYKSSAVITGGTITAHSCVELLSEGSTCEISGGTFNASGSQVCYAFKGFFTISGGTFKSGGTNAVQDDIYRYTLNCYDSNYTADPALAGFTVTGGTFYEFNPLNNRAEGENTDFTPGAGYSAEYDAETGYYTLIKD